MDELADILPQVSTTLLGEHSLQIQCCYPWDYSYEVAISPAENRTMARARASAKMCIHVHTLSMRFLPDQYPCPKSYSW